MLFRPKTERYTFRDPGDMLNLTAET